MANLNDTDKNKLKIFIEKFFCNLNILLKKKIYNNIKRIINFSRKNLDFIYYDYLFFFIKNSNIKYLKSIIFIIKKFNIKIYHNIPSKEDYYINLKLNKNLNLIDEKINNCTDKFLKNQFYKTVNNLKTDYDILNIYKLMEKFFKNIKYNIINKKFLFKVISLKLKINKVDYERFINNKIFKKKNLQKLDKEIYNIVLNKKSIIKDYKFNKKLFYKFIKILKDIFMDSKIGKLRYKLFFNKFKFIKNDLIFDSNLLNEIYDILFIYNKKISTVKYKLYDILLNFCKIDWLTFVFYFNKNGININWIYNISDLSNMNVNFKKKYKNFINRQKKILINFEKSVFMTIQQFIKLYIYIELKKFRIDIIRNDILESNLYLVNYAAYKYFNNDLYWDFNQEGVFGLIYSINKFNPKYKNFKSFASFNIRSSMNRFYYKSSKLISLPRAFISSIKKINEISDNYYNRFFKKPSVSYLQKKSNLSEKTIIRVLRVFNEPVSIDNKINSDPSDETRYIDIIKDESQKNIEENVYNIQINNCIDKLLKSFNNKTKNVISMLYGVGGVEKLSFSKISEICKINKHEIINIKNKFLKKIKESKFNIDKLLK